MLSLCALSSVARAQGGAPPGPGYEVVSDGPALELRFHNMPLKSVHADDSQNALSLDFQTPVDGAIFDHLGSAMPQWIAMAYTNYDNGVIRATRPVTFLTRPETDGFSLRMVPRDGGAPPPPPQVALRGGYAGEAPPMQMPMGPPPMPGGAPPPGYFPLYQSYSAIRNYEAMELALHRGDAMWQTTYDRAALQSDSEAGLGTEYHYYHRGDTVITSQAHARIAVGGGLSLIGTLDDTDSRGDSVRGPGGDFHRIHSNILTGEGGIALEAWNDTEVTLEAVGGNNIVGGRIKAYGGDADSFLLADISYHKPDMDTPEAIWAHGLRDEAVLATGRHLGYGLWGSLASQFDNYGQHGDASVAQSAGWNANLRWATDFGGILAGVSYDGHGEYLISNDTLGSGANAYVPLSLRNLETHSVTASLSGLIWGDTLWLDLYGGYVDDRYASGGALYGGAVHYTPAPGVDLAMGARHSTVSLTQSEVGAETSAGLSFTLGFGGAPRAERIYY